MNNSTISNVSDVYKPPFDEAGTIVSATTVFPLSVVGTIANVITIIVIVTSQKLKTTLNLLILSLCVSDLTSAVISPLFVYRRSWGYEYWYWSDFLCKTYSAVDLWTTYVTCIHILLFAMLRFVSVQWTSKFNDVTNKQIKITIVAVWSVTFAVGFIPAVYFYGASVRDRSSSTPDSKWPSCSINKERIAITKTYAKIAYPLFVYLPVLLVIVFSIGIAIKIFSMRRVRSSMISKNRKSSGDNPVERKRRRKENQIMFQLALIVGSFLFAYVPLTAFHFYTLGASSSRYQSVINWWFGYFQFLFMRISECLNPVFYNLASSKMRRETKKMLQRSFMRCKCKKHDDVTHDSVQSAPTLSSKVSTSRL